MCQENFLIERMGWEGLGTLFMVTENPRVGGSIPPLGTIVGI